MIYFIGKGVYKRTKLFVLTGSNYGSLTDMLQYLSDCGYVDIKFVDDGRSVKNYFLTDKGVQFYRVINQYFDILGKNINSLDGLFS